jgi:hypothetical protein
MYYEVRKMHRDNSGIGFASPEFLAAYFRFTYIGSAAISVPVDRIGWCLNFFWLVGFAVLVISGSSMSVEEAPAAWGSVPPGSRQRRR